MNDPNSLKDDISFMRRLAEQGRSAPILGGVFLAAFGVLFGTACFVQWGMMLRGVTDAWSIIGMWAGAMVLGLIVWLLIYFQMRNRGVSASDFQNSSFHTSWLASGIGITVCCIAVGVAGAVIHNATVMTVYPPLVFSFYGTAWLVSGVLARRRWMYGAAGGAYLFALILALLTSNSLQVVAMGFALYLTLTVPGVLLMREKAL